MKKRKWSDEEMAKHGWSIYYYGGWFINLKAPKNLSRDEHYDYLKQKENYINRIGNTISKSSILNGKIKSGK